MDLKATVQIQNFRRSWTQFGFILPVFPIPGGPKPRSPLRVWIDLESNDRSFSFDPSRVTLRTSTNQALAPVGYWGPGVGSWRAGSGNIGRLACGWDFSGFRETMNPTPGVVVIQGAAATLDARLEGGDSHGTIGFFGASISGNAENTVKIGTKLVISLVVPLVALMALFGYLSQRTSRAHLEDEMKREGRAVARTMQLAIEDYLRDHQFQDIHELADELSNYERILGIRIFDRRGALLYQSSSLSTRPFSRPEALERVLLQRRSSETHLEMQGQPVVNLMVPLSSEEGKPLGALQVLQLESFIEEEARSARESVAAITAVMILAVAGIVLLVTRYSVSRPVEELVRSFREVGSGEPFAKVPVTRRDELGRLAEEFDTMCHQLESARKSLLAQQEERILMETRLRDSERLASLGRISAGLAHEIGTPLNVIRGRAETPARKRPGNDTATRNLQIIVAQISRIARMVHGTLDFARPREPRRAPTAVVPVLRKVLEFLSQRIEEAGVRVESSLSGEFPSIVADADKLHEVFLNLATNALDAMSRGGTLRIRAECVQARHPERGGPTRPFLAIAFEDNGSGIAAEHLGRVFDSFFTTKKVGKGTGLGLSISHGIVRDHGGWIDVASEVNRGTRLTVYLPLPETPASTARVAAGEVS